MCLNTADATVKSNIRRLYWFRRLKLRIAEQIMVFVLFAIQIMRPRNRCGGAYWFVYYFCNITLFNLERAPGILRA